MQSRRWTINLLLFGGFYWAPWHVKELGFTRASSPSDTVVRIENELLASYCTTVHITIHFLQHSFDVIGHAGLSRAVVLPGRWKKHWFVGAVIRQNATGARRIGIVSDNCFDCLRVIRKSIFSVNILTILFAAFKIFRFFKSVWTVRSWTISFWSMLINLI